MALDVVRGSTCRICFYPQGGLKVDELGDPSIGISQELTFLTPTAVVDTENNRVYADLTENDTIQLVENIDTTCQLVFTPFEEEIEEGSEEDGSSEEGGEESSSETVNGPVYRFPEHKLNIVPTIFGAFYSVPVNTSENPYEDESGTEEGGE